jgi:hypothetical protein
MRRDDIEKLERTVEHEMALLAALPRELPTPGAVARVQVAVASEAKRLGRLRGTRGLPAWLRVAASLLLAFGLVQSLTSMTGPRGRDAEPALQLEMWAQALDESNDRLAFMLEEGWLLEPDTDPTGNGAEVDVFLDSVDDSFEQLSSMGT